jgi:spoIIIJ-associated protein
MDDTQRVEQGRQWLETLLPLTGFPASVSVRQPAVELAADTLWLTIDSAHLSPEQVQSLTGAKGQVLDAVQYLLNATLNLGQPRDSQLAFTVELADYRARRYGELQALAEEVAAQVRQTSQEQEMPPLSSTERRFLHTLFQSSEDLETYSHGQEPDRRLVVRLRSPE